ncbi:hypothetical protein [Ferrimonas marina]|uniref:Uncharacterized protein n=1 Tax=Ferrimonas marina TaxID=299255 RepID=A0A1M5Z981_9GAMM|nr:hypothetical protein [Ferrimonas marina]SHI20780.1 hypothetical protein SAMN02745129_0036 [Ferrimonas marina]
MFLVSHFPNVPITTANPATEQVAAQVRPPIPKAEALSKGAKERALDPKQDPNRQVQEGGQRQSGQQQDSEQADKEQQESRRELAPLRECRGALLRRRALQANAELDFPYHPATELTPDQYRRFAALVERHYRGVTRPQTPPQLLVST